MAYTQEDLATLYAMKMSLLQGKRVVRSEVAGKTLEFQVVKIADLDAAITVADLDTAIADEEVRSKMLEEERRAAQAF